MVKSADCSAVLTGVAEMLGKASLSKLTSCNQPTIWSNWRTLASPCCLSAVAR